MKNAILIVCLAAAVFLLAGCGGSSNSTPPANTSANNSSPATQPDAYAQKKVDIASLTQAVQQYNASEGHYPATLQDLVPNYIAKVPDAPPGYTLNYNSTSGTVTLDKQ